jgi:NADH-quinone oxidoreductase subunit N
MLKIALMAMSFGALLVMQKSLRADKINSFEYTILVLFSVLGMLLLVCSANLLSLYLALELQSLVLYVLASFSRSSAFSAEAGLKYFILGALSSGFYLFGAVILYG